MDDDERVAGPVCLCVKEGGEYREVGTLRVVGRSNGRESEVLLVKVDADVVSVEEATEIGEFLRNLFGGTVPVVVLPANIEANIITAEKFVSELEHMIRLYRAMKRKPGHA